MLAVGGVEGQRCWESTQQLTVPRRSGRLRGSTIGAWGNGRGRTLAECQGSEGVVWGEMRRDGQSVVSLLREHLGARERRFERAGGEVG